MDRKQLQGLAAMRAQEAKVLLAAGAPSGAYYLAGYAVECGLKACIARKVRRHEFPDKRTVQDSYTHDLATLIRIAGLGNIFKDDRAANAALETNWLVVKDWSEQSRYEFLSALQGRDMVAAVAHREDGVLRWVKRYW